jgi:multidrug resistance efflux pump
MFEELKEKAIEIRSEEVNEILGKTPVWILRKGIILLTLIIVAIFTGSWLFKYPDIITAPIVITSQNPPSPLIARTSGKIMAIYVKDQQQVKEGQYLAVLENASDLQSVLLLKTQLLNENILNTDKKIPITSTFRHINNLGELQQLYISWCNSKNDYERFIQQNFAGKKVKSIRDQIGLTYHYIEKLESQNVLQAQDLKISNKQYRRDSLLFQQKVTPQAGLDEAEIKLLSAKSSYKNSEIALSNTQIQLTQLEQQILEIQLKEEEDKKKMLDAINANVQSLRNQLQAWELAYALKSPVSGKVVLGNYWSTNQQVKAGDQVMTIVPDKASIPFGKITLPMQGAGKVKPGQKVNIKLTNYPYLEYGMVRGVVNRLSEVPNQNNYLVEIKLSAGLKTNYNKSLHFDQEMTGTADIITEDMRLLERTLSPLRSIMNQ